MSSIIEFFQSWGDQLYSTFIEEERYKMLIDGLENTLIITFGALLIGVALGAVIAIIKYFSDDSPVLRAIAGICDVYVTVIRGIPVVVLLLIFYYLIMVSSEGVAVAIVTFGLNSAAYMAELIRSGINAVDTGQMEAGRSLGMSKIQTMYKIIMPQAVKNILPAIGNEMIALLKETAVAGYVAVVDLTRAGNLIRNNTYDAFNPLIAIALIYLILVALLTLVLRLLEKRWSTSDRSKKSA